MESKVANTNNQLTGLKVLELASVLAGPAVGTFLAELGAEVTKIENPKTGGDVTRSWKLKSEDSAAPDSAYFHSVNYGKTHLFYDLKDSVDCECVRELAVKADVIITNFRPGQGEQFGLDYKTIKQQNSEVVYANISGFDYGNNRPAYDVVLQAESGFMYMNGEPKGNPTKMPVALIDVLAAHQLKQAVLLSLLKRNSGNGGSFVNVSLLDAAVSALVNQASNWLMAGHIPQRMGSLHPNIAPYGETLTTKDDKLIVLAVGSQKQFESLCEILGLKEILKDLRFSDNQSRIENRTELQVKLNQKSQQLFCTDLMGKLLEKSVPAGVIKNMKEVFETPEAQAMILSDGISHRVSQIGFKFLE